MIRFGFLINPIAGMGGKVGLKGTDGVLAEAVARGAIPIAEERALDAITKFINQYKERIDLMTDTKHVLEWFTCNGRMGFDTLKKAGITEIEYMSVRIIYEPISPKNTTAEDTKRAISEFLRNSVKLIIFCGGDGTARDIYSVAKDKALLLGIPAGVKMHSGVFATHTKVVGEIIIDFLNGLVDSADGEILDLDEEKYRAGEWNIRLFGIAKTPHCPSLIQRGKHMVETVSEDMIKEEIAEYLKEEIEDNPDTMYILGSGSTVKTITKQLGVDGTLLGVDVIYNGKLIGKDVNENQLLDYLDRYKKVRLIISPIGAQGFILGRGNLQISPAVIKRIGIDNIDILSTPAKLSDIEVLRVDTNDTELDRLFEDKGWIKVIFGYRQMRLKRVGK